jgi:hypothetical protein
MDRGNPTISAPIGVAGAADGVGMIPRDRHGRPVQRRCLVERIEMKLAGEGRPAGAPSVRRPSRHLPKMGLHDQAKEDRANSNSV